MVEPVTAVATKNGLAALWAGAKSYWNSRTGLKKKLEDSQRHCAVLQAQLDKETAFQRRLAEYVCKPEDDNIYWRADGQGICPLCVEDERITPLTMDCHKNYFCKLHDHAFTTKECREAREATIKKWSRPRRILRGPNAWMAR